MRRRVLSNQNEKGRSRLKRLTMLINTWRVRETFNPDDDEADDEGQQQ
jgi:hypothetical protein